MTGAPICCVALALAACSRSDRSEQPPAREHARTLPRHLRNCPSAVASARTTVRPTVDGVEVTITSPEPQAAQQILQLTRVQARLPEPFWFFGPDSGPGDLGRCPIIHANTRLSYDELADGVRIHVAARTPSAVAPLQEATRARLRALRDASS
jgi:hypothetical protein